MYAELTAGALPIKQVKRNPVVRTGNSTYRIRSMTPPDRFNLGWVEFVTNRVNTRLYDAGAAVDVLDLPNHTVTRTYPNATLKDQVEQRRLRFDELRDIYEFKRSQDFQFGGQDISTDMAMRTHIGLIAQYAAVNAGPFPIQRKNGTFVSVTPAQAQALFEAMMAHMLAVDTAADAHVTALQALTDPQQIIDYDLTAGWPT